MSMLDPSRIRNVGVLGHGGVGKTTLIENVLHDAGVVNRVGTVEDGTTVGDYLQEEKEHHHTITMKLAHVDWNGVRVHLVDHPGYADFVGEVAASSAVLDGVVILVDGAAGPEVGTDNAVKYADLHKVPRAFFVNKLDRDQTDFATVVEQLKEAYGKACVPLVVPTGSGPISGVVNILDEAAESDPAFAALREQAMDVVAETDDSLTEKYLDGQKLTPDELRQGLHDGIARGDIMPILAGSATQDIGMRELLDLIALCFPSPVDRHVVVHKGDGSLVELEVSPDAPFLGQVFHSAIDPYVGHLTFFRVLTGTLKSQSDFINHTRGHKERTGQIYLLNGAQQEPVEAVGPGDLAAMTKLKDTHFGDTIEAIGADFEADPIELPEGMVKLAIVPKSRADEDKIGESLGKLHEEDPTFDHFRDEQTHEHIIRGMGDMQLEVLLERMERQFGVHAEVRPPRIAYKETIRGSAEAHGRHKKQSGGHGQFGDVHIRVRPNERGAGYEFVDSITGGVVPRQFIPSVDKGSQDALAKGIISGHPVVDIVVELYDGSFHTVDSSDMAFQVAASMAIQEAVQKARPCLLEPVANVSVTTPDEYLGDITGDLNGRRGRILGIEPAPGGKQTIQAQVPEREMLSYASKLRSITHGKGSYESRFSHYEELPEHLEKAVIAEGNGKA
ncbi:MAG: elongation factor G [Candidatus Hydrogenedens sp.]|nr:elongation factor G [Candidatus Hydrogenedens sp.]